MRHALIAIVSVLAATACASAGDYSGAAYITAGILELSAVAPTIEACADNVRMATRIPDPTHLGQVTQRAGGSDTGDIIGTCAGPDRMHLITATEIRPRPRVMIER